VQSVAIAQPYPRRPIQSAQTTAALRAPVSDLNRSAKEVMSPANPLKDKRKAGILYLLAAVVSLLASMCWFLANNAGQGFMWLVLELVWATFSTSRLRNKEPIQPPQTTTGSSAPDCG
jgi:hypothetical protein